MQFCFGAGKHSRMLDTLVLKIIGVNEGEKLLLGQHLTLFFACYKPEGRSIRVGT
jgi:hypothetical protein